MKYNFNKICLMFAASVFFAGFLTACGDQPLFDEMAESRLRVVIKGTFESNDPKGWEADINSDVLLEDTNSVNDLLNTDPVYNDAAPTRFMMDIAEFQLGKKRIGNYRQLFTADISLADTDPFFNGTGFELRNDDPPGESFGSVRMFIRKMIFNNATQYYLDPLGLWTQGETVEVLFHEKSVGGLDFNQLQVNSYFDSLQENSDDINRVFPLNIPIEGGFVYDNNEEETVLEIRLVIKNFVKKYEYDFYNDNGYHAVYHYYALSDWLRDVREDENNIGGNLFAVARTYVPGKTADITGIIPGAGYVIAIPATDNIDQYLIPSGNHDGNARPPRDDINCLDAPATVFLPAANSVESYLDYFLKYEQYKVRYNSFVTNVEDTDYATNWTTYENDVSTFKIPPLATHSDIASYTLTNVPLGESFNFYFIPDVNVGYGELPDFGDYTQQRLGVMIDGSPVDIP